MYEAHFGLREAPFTLTPNTSFYFDSPVHREALNTLVLALRGGEGFVKVTGEVGTGKTLLCRHLINDLGDDFAIAYVPDPCLDADTLRRSVADEFGVAGVGDVDNYQLQDALRTQLLDFHESGRWPVIVVDEAQALSDEAIEALRLLTNLETERFKLLQVVLLGQPELDRRLAEPKLRQLRQRIAFSYQLDVLSLPQVRRYIGHRLHVAGARNGALISRGATDAIARASGGVPRLINILAHKALLAAYGEGAERVRARHVRRAVADTEAVQPARRAWLWWAGAAAMVLAVCASLYGVRP